MTLLIRRRALPPRLPAVVYESVVLADARGEAGEFVIVAGLSPGLVTDLRARSLDGNDVELARRTSDRVRFGQGSYEDWFGKERCPFALVSDEALAGLIWYGPSAPPAEAGLGADSVWDTIAFRSYQPYRGSGLMVGFSRFVLQCHEQYASGRRLWLETDSDNGPGLQLYERLGFKLVASLSQRGRVIMVAQ